MEQKMEITSAEECRLCLGELTEIKSSIEKPDLKKQLSQVFNFELDSLPGYPSDVCSQCLSIVTEFHQYAQKVRNNQQTIANRLKIKTESTPSDDGGLDDFHEIKQDASDSSDGEVFAEPFVSVVVKSEPKANRSSESQEEEVKKEKVQPTRKKKKKIIPKDNQSSESQEEEEDEEEEKEEVEKPKRKKKKKTIGKEKRNIKDIDLKSKEELQQQDVIIQEFYEMKCDLCGDAAQDLNSLRSHFRAAHGQGIYIKCCKKKLSRKWAMIDHITVHTNPTAFRCEVCDKTFKSKRYLREHLANVHGSAEKRPFQCDQCNRFFAKESLLETHKRHHEKMPCPQCGQVFANSISLKAHMKGAHDDTDRTKVCDRCGKGFAGPSAPSNLRQHIDKVHMGLGDKTKHQCPMCFKWLLGKRALTIHVQLHNEVGKPHICNICNQNYLHSRALTRHKRFVHGEYKYECEFCGKKFKKSLALKEHRATHTGETLYSCKVCPVSMNSNASYYAHMKKAHPIEWAESKLKAAEANGTVTADDSVTT